VVPTTGAGSEYDSWIARCLADPTNISAGMSQALAGTSQFMALYGTTSATELATASFVTELWSRTIGTGGPGPGAMMNVGLPVWQVLQNFVQSAGFVSRMTAPTVNFQDLLLDGQTPTGSIFTLPTAPPFAPIVGQTLTLTIGVDTPATGFTSGHGATATAANSTFSALPGSNPPLGVANTLNTGDDLEATGAAAGTTTLNLQQVPTPLNLINPPLAAGVTMNGVSSANITNLSGGVGGFSGSITGLTTVTLMAGSNAGEVLGTPGFGLNTALTTVNLQASQNFTAWMSVAALAGAADAVSINITGPYGTALAAHDVRLVNTTGAGNGYETVKVAADSPTFLQLGGAGGGVVDGTQSTTEVDLSGAGAIQLSAAVVGEYANVTKINASANMGGVTITGHTTGGMAGARGFLDGNTVLTSFQGGGGADLVDLSSMTAAQIGAMTTDDGGAGRDTLVVDHGAATAGTNLNDTNFEILQVNAGLTGTVNWANLGANIDTFQLLGSATGDVTINNAINGATVALGAFSGANHNWTVNGPAGIADVLNVTSVAHGNDFHDVTINGFEVANWTFSAVSFQQDINGNLTLTPSLGGGETLNIVDTASPGGNDLVVHGTTNLGANGLINISGAGLGNIAFDGAVTAGKIDGHAFSGHLFMGQPGATGPITIIGSALSDTLVGSHGNDVINLNNGGGNVITTGGGADVITLDTGAAPDIVNLYGFTGIGPLGDGSSIVNDTDAAGTGFWGATAAGWTPIWGVGGASLLGTVTAAGISNGTNTDMSVINHFVMGPTGDQIQLDVNQAAGPGDISAWQHTFALLNPLGGQAAGVIDGGNAFIPVGDANIFFSSPGATMNALSSVVELQGNYANAASAAAQIHTLQHFSLDLAIPNTADVHLILAYQDQTGNTRISDLDLVNNSGAATADTAHMNVFVSDMVQLVGQPVSTLTDHNVHFV
jgi:hypothetical protein